MLAQNMPIATSPMNTEVEFAHLGVNVSNKETTRKLHNRAATKFRLRDFSDFNLTAGDEMVAVQCSKDQLQLSKKMKPLDNPQECVKAVYNYAAMHGQFHPMDWSPKALLKLMLNKMFEGPPTVDQYVRLFEKFISENGGRAQKNGVPLTYMEIVGLWNTFIAPSHLNMVAMDKVIDNKMKQFMKGRGPSPSPSLATSPSKRARLTKEDFCQDWNNSKTFPLCSNTQSQGGCMFGGKFLKHSCSRKTQSGRSCGIDGHSFHTH